MSEPRLSEAQLSSSLHPELARWMRRRFGHFAPAQRLAVPEILEGHSTLVSSPTGSGKTLTAFLGIFDYLAKARDAGTLASGIVAVYISPLRALAYDLQKNLQQPLAEMGWDWLRVAARTGDTTPKERERQKRRPPHILVTTPESLTLLVSQPSWLPALKPARFLVADELHALAENKRGALLMVSAERLEEIGSRPLLRVGLSATLSPLESVAEFLVGPQRDCRIIEVTQRKAARIEVFSPLRKDAYPPAGYTGKRVLAELVGLLAKKRTTLIFTNTRSGAETVGHRLKELIPGLASRIEVHHASLDRSVRLEVEDRLRKGELRAVVCSTSLEMGIDIGFIDLVVMVAAPKGVARALQRLGRSGHSMGATSHGLLVASNINDLAECAATARMMERRSLEPVKIHENPLDVLAQTLVGLAVFGSMTPDEAFALVRRSYPFRALGRADFDRVLRYLEGGGVSLERAYRSVFGKVRLDDRGQMELASAAVARSLYQNIGTITSESMVQVRLRRRNLGEIEESFMRRMNPGDVFVLNGRSLRLVKTHFLTAFVAPADGAVPTIPRWYANKMPLASGLAEEVARLRTVMAARLDPDWLISEYGLSPGNARALTAHFALQARISAIPTSEYLLVELYRHRGLSHYFFHSLIGRSANDALSRIIAQRVKDAKGGNALTTIDDYGFLLTVRPFQEAPVDAWRTLFARTGAEESLRAALAESSLVKWHFRGTSQTGLMVPRRVHGADRGARATQFSSEIIFDVLRKYEPDHPLLTEAYSESVLRFLDLPRAIAFMERAAALPWDLREVDRISPFSFGIYASTIKETMTLEDPETTIERLYNEMYGQQPPANDRDPP
ncbi:MAG TPA: DEAD/DEAH box helicase [Opitutaceae bacterium]